jgi:hypothetical protein
MRTSSVTSQGSLYARCRRALDSQNATVAFATATELDFVSLPDVARARPPPGRRFWESSGGRRCAGLGWIAAPQRAFRGMLWS